MTITEIEPFETTSEETDVQVMHYECCRLGFKAICGTDLDVIIDDDSEDDVDCIVCEDLWQGCARHVMKFGHAHCPLNVAVICPISQGLGS